MWFPGITLLGFAAQLPFMSSPLANVPSRNTAMISEFSLKAGNGRFTPKDLIELPRPDAGKANVAGDLVLVSVSKYSFADNKRVISYDDICISLILT